MLEKIDEEEVQFMELFFTPLAMAECLFSNFDNLTEMRGEELAHIRLGQTPMLSHEWLLDSMKDLSEKENFSLRKGAGDLYALGGRLFGKTLIVEKVDLLVCFVVSENERVGFSSYDQIHIRGVLEDIVTALDFHPFLKLFNPKINKSPNYRISSKSGFLLESVNQNLAGKNPGRSFFQKHFTRLYSEECSFETEEIYRQRRDSVSELGCVYRFAGMTNFTKYSPCGKVFYDLSKKASVLNLPQVVNPRWDDKAKEQAVKDFGGEQSMGFRVFVLGQVVEDGVSTFDMNRVRLCYNEDKVTKIFEVSKDNFSYFENVVVVERPKNASLTYIFADIGETAPTEIGIVFEVNRQYQYRYNITLFNLTDKEQYKFFKWLAEQIGANFIAIDCSDGTGRSIFRSLAEVFPKDHMVWVSFNEKIAVDFEKDESGRIIFKNNLPEVKEEYTTEWSVKRLKDLLYSGRMDIPVDYKFDLQFNSVVALQSGPRVVYECVASQNHLFQAFQVFAIAQWYHEWTLNKGIKKTSYFKSGV